MEDTPMIMLYLQILLVGVCLPLVAALVVVYLRRLLDRD